MVKRLRTKSDYIKAGVTPPEQIVHPGSEEVPIDTHLHLWVHKDGPWLHCEAGEFGGHGVPFDHLNKILVGTDASGAPLLQDLTLSSSVPNNKD